MERACYYRCGRSADWRRKAQAIIPPPTQTRAEKIEREEEAYVCDACTPRWRVVGAHAYEPLTETARARLAALEAR